MNKAELIKALAELFAEKMELVERTLSERR